MPTRFSLSVRQNFKHSVSKNELTDDATALLAVIPWILPATFFGLNGWMGLLVSFASTWGLGAAFNIPGLRRGAWALAAVQIVYANFSQQISDVVGKPVWRFDSNGGVVSLPTVDVNSQTPGVQGLASAMQAGASLQRMPDGTYGVAYPGVADRYVDSYPQSQLAGFYTDDNYNGNKAVGAAPSFSASAFGN